MSTWSSPCTADMHACRGCFQIKARLWLQANAPQYWRIDTSQPLCSQLQGRTVIEFPTLLVRAFKTNLPHGSDYAKVCRLMIPKAPHHPTSVYFTLEFSC